MAPVNRMYRERNRTLTAADYVIAERALHDYARSLVSWTKPHTSVNGSPGETSTWPTAATPSFTAVMRTMPRARADNLRRQGNRSRRKIAA